jgi:hypothetical protein
VECELTTNNRSCVSAGTDPIVFVALGGGFIAGALFVSWTLSFASPAVLKHLTHVANTLSPFAPFFMVLAAGIGWFVAARLNGAEARRTEREKRDVANKAFRGHVEARLARVWAVIDEAVGVQPYQPTVVEQFISDVEELCWRGETTFDAFARNERNSRGRQRLSAG